VKIIIGKPSAPANQFVVQGYKLGEILQNPCRLFGFYIWKLGHPASFDGQKAVRFFVW
jgi:hypothetical protein